MVRKIILAGLVAVVPTGVQAQGRGAMAPAFRGAAVAPRVTVAAPHAGAPRVVAGPRMVVRTGAPRPRVGMPIPRSARRITRRSRFAENEFAMHPGCSSAPGFGFDAVHQAATCGSSVVNSGRVGNQVPLFFPFFDGGFFLPGSSAAVEETSSSEALQPEISESGARERSRRFRAAESAALPTVEVASAAGPVDNDEFVFVRRNGTVFFAVAYSWEKGTLRYVTSQGLRQTVTQDALDLDATRQFNEQRGLNFRLPA